MPSMGSASDLTLQYRRPYVKISSSMMKPSSCPVRHEMDDQMQKLEEHLKALEEERLKIEAFKRELPFCMELLNDAIEASEEQLASYGSGSYAETIKCGIKEGESGLTSDHKPVLEEFIPVNKICTEESKEIELKSMVNGDKIDWMSSAQLWSQNCDTKESAVRQPQKSLMPLNDKQRVGGAFHPFSREREEMAQRCSAPRGLPDLGLSSAEPEETRHHGGLNNNKRCINEEGDQNEGCIVPCNRNMSSTDSHTPQQLGQTQRKARRCWSPELHRKFVNALQQLGGSQVATPKQIRELMKVDGLTNDEVKSHLQKYRLHTRRLPSSGCPQAMGTVTQAPQLVVLGGIWVPPEYAAHHGHAAPELYTALPNIASQSHAARYYRQRQPAIDGNSLQEFCTSYSRNHVESSSQPQSDGSPQSSSSMSMEADQDGKSGSQSFHGSWKEKEMGNFVRAPQL